MITKEVIASIYKKYRNRPKAIEDLDLAPLADDSMKLQNLSISDDVLHIGSLPKVSPFAEIPLDRMHAILEFDRHVAIVLHSSIIFLQKNSDHVDVHVKLDGPSLMDRLKMKMSL